LITVFFTQQFIVANLFNGEPLDKSIREELANITDEGEDNHAAAAAAALNYQEISL